MKRLMLAVLILPSIGFAAETFKLVCDGDDPADVPEEIVLVLNTSKKTLSFGDAAFSCQ